MRQERRIKPDLKGPNALQRLIKGEAGGKEEVDEDVILSFRKEGSGMCLHAGRGGQY